MEKTFIDEYTHLLRSTIYVSGNPHTRSYIDHSEFQDIDEVWRYAWDTEIGTVPPKPITDRAIVHWRTASPDRMLVHYMQPHIPFIPADQGSNLTPDRFGEQRFNDTWLQLRDGELDRDTVWEQYRRNLEYVLKQVKFLSTTIDANTVIVTSDHGNALGELGIYGHYNPIPIPALRTVPWAETTAKRIREYDPPEYDITDSDGDVADRLAALGYQE
jgi:hypothetical protein